MEEKIITILITASRILYLLAIYERCKPLSKKSQNIITAVSFPFPIIAGIICAVKTKGTKNTAKSVIAFILSVILMLAGFITYSTTVMQDKLWFDSQGNKYFYLADVLYYDNDGVEYGYDFDKTGFDYLYSSSGDKLNADWCYLDENGELYYDDDMSITAKDEKSCVDTNGEIYYPVKYSRFSKDGKIEYYFKSANFRYDRLGNAYTYDYVPYYDTDGNKYYYSFNSDTQKGTYTKISDGKSYENEKCYVDENGYLVYDKNAEFIKDESKDNTYTDSKGNTYHWASGIYWDINTNIIDA